MKKCVLDGGPSSGKTTLLEEIARRGHETREETALQIIQKDPGLFKNRPVEFSRLVYQEQKILEDSLEGKEGIVTLDHGLIACKGYYLAQGITVPYELEQFLEKANYDCIFLCEMLPEQYWAQTRNGHPRKGTYQQGVLIHGTIRFLYRRSDLLVVDIPFLDVPSRADLVEGYLSLLDDSR